MARGLNLTPAVIYIHTLCMRAARALAYLYISAGLPEPWLLPDEMNTKISNPYTVVDLKSQN